MYRLRDRIFLVGVGQSSSTAVPTLHRSLRVIYLTHRKEILSKDRSNSIECTVQVLLVYH